jgi:hypothetical protein
VPRGPDIPIPISPLSQTKISSPFDVDDDDVHFSTDIESKNPHPFNQSELNDLVRDLGLTKQKNELLGSRLKQQNILVALAVGTSHRKFPFLSEENVKEGVFDGPQIWPLIRNSTFTNSMNDLQLQARDLFKGNFKDPQYEGIVKTMLEKLQALRHNMSLKSHFLQSHLDYFPEN